MPRLDGDNDGLEKGWDSRTHARSTDNPPFLGSTLAGNLLRLFDRAAEKGGERPFLWYKKNKDFVSLSWAEVAKASAALANYLTSIGLRSGDRVVLVSENRPEWCIADLAIMRAGGITVPAYATNMAEDHRYIVEHSEAVMAIIGNRIVAERMAAGTSGMSALRHVVLMDGEKGNEFPCPTTDWLNAIERGQRNPNIDFGAKITGDDLACFIYTSGTGGRPKGVMLSHRNIMANMWGAYDLIDKVGIDQDVFLSFLPLSHSYEHTVGQFLPMAINAEIYYAEGAEHLARNFEEVKPTIVACVPRLYEVLRHKMLATVERDGGFQAKAFRETVRLGKQKYQSGGKLPPMDGVKDLFLERLVRNKVRNRFGGRLKALVSGGAPLNSEVGLFFTALGLPVLQGYGQTESSPVISVNPPFKVKLETVGPPLDGVELKIAQDGEILVRGDLVMHGYWKDIAATAETVRDGWLHTGDIGTIDADGYLRITDRKKDMIVNSGGDNIAPQRVEGRLMLEPEIEQAVVFGDRQPFLIAIIVPRQELTRGSKKSTGNSSSPDSSSAQDYVRKKVDAAVKKANSELSVIERVRRFVLADEPFTPENGLMTPTMKLKRTLVYARYKHEIAKLYRNA
ncbi:MAG: AMP-dependent synthetase/ligase [Pseudomonadota bacterium]